MKVFRSIAKVIDKTSDVISICIGILCVFLLIFVTANALMRYLFAEPVWGAEEINGYVLGAIILLGLGPVLKEKGHIRVEIMSVVLPARVKRILEIMNSIVIIVWSLIMVIGAFSYAQYVINIGKRTQTLEIPIVSFYWYVILGTVLFSLVALVEALRLFTAKSERLRD
ncbi:TRAP transporter small permease [Chloroflexota bacterium]